MKRLLVICVLFSGCGSGGSDVEVQPAANPSSIVCEDSGNVYRCDVEGACVEELNKEIVAQDEDTSGFLVQDVAPVAASTGEDLGQTTPAKVSFGGNLDVINSCGGIVNISISEGVK